MANPGTPRAMGMSPTAVLGIPTIPSEIGG